MKKVGIIVLALVLLLGFGTMAAYAKANKVDLNDMDGNPVGWVIFNKNASGDIIAQVHLNNGAEGTYMAQLRVEFTDIPRATAATEPLTVNRQGKGNSHLKGDSADVVEVKVRVREDTNGFDTVYRTEWHAI